MDWGDPASGGMALSNTTPYSGTTTATLSISNINNLIGNTYYVVVSNPNWKCGSVKKFATLSSTVVDLAITKTNTPGSGPNDQINDTVTRGQTTTYNIVVTNNGPMSVTGAKVTDTATGLTCGGNVTCTSSSGSSCPTTTQTAATLLSTGITLQALPVGGTATLSLACTVD